MTSVERFLYARRNGDITRLEKSTAIEISKQQRIGALGEIVDCEADLPIGSIVVDAHVLYKLKADDRDTCRLAIMGNRMPKEPTSKTFASVVSDGAKMFSFAAMQAHCAMRGEDLIISDADVVGGFLHIPLNSPVPLFVRMPKSLPHPIAGKLVRILAAIYGLQESNRLFNLEMTRVIVQDAGFVCTQVESQVFIKCLKSDSGKKCITCVTVDDAVILSNEQSLVDDLLAALSKRFGPLTVNKVTTVHTGLEVTRYPNGALLITQDRSIARAASVVGVSHLPPVDLPVALDFFQLCTDPLLLFPVDATVYSSLTGRLVQYLKTRHEIRQFVSYLCSFNVAPLECHYRQAIHMLRYIASTPGMGCVFRYSGDVVITAASDSACGIFPDGRSSGAHLLSIGPDNAPFICSAKAQIPVATCPMTGEYYSAGDSCSDIIHYRQLAEDLGWIQLDPTVLCVDNQTALSLAVAPQVSKKSRHIFIKYHNIRWLVLSNVISLKYVPTKQMRANVLTKALSKKHFVRERDVLFNRLALD